MSEVKHAFWDYFFLLGGKFWAFFLRSLSIILLTAFLGAKGYGEFSVFLAVANFFNLFFGWTQAAFLKYGREEFLKDKTLYKSFWSRNFFLFLSFVILVLIMNIDFLGKFIKNYLSFMGNSFILKVLFIYIFSSILFEYAQSFFQVIGKLKRYALFFLINNILIVVGLVFLSFFKNLFSFDPLLEIIFLYVTINFFVSVPVLLSKLKLILPLFIHKKWLQKFFYFSYPLIFSSFSAYLINWIDNIMIKKYLGLKEVGIYYLSYRIMSVLKEIPATLITLMLPTVIALVVKKKEDLIRKFIKTLIPQLLFLWNLFLMVFIFALVYIFPLVFSSEFKRSLNILIILFIGLSINAIVSVYSPFITAYELIKKVVIFNIIMAILNLIGDYYLIPYLGIKGAAISTIVSFFVGAAGYLFIVNRKLYLQEWYHLLFIFPLVCEVVIFLYWKTFILRIGMSFLLFGICIWFVRKMKIFSLDDLVFYKNIKMPEAARKILYKVYYYLS